MKKFFSAFAINLISLLFIVNLSIACNDCDNLSIKEKIEKTTSDYFSTHFFNAVYEIKEGDKLVSKGAKGFASFENSTLLRDNQQMPVASVTKSMTAAAILKLQEKGLLNVQDTVAKHLTAESDLWKDKKVPAWAEKVKIHHLLTHTSGIAEYFMAMPINADQPHEQINKDIINFAASKDLAYEPGTKFTYTNTNFVLLGLIVEQASGQKLAKFFDKELFKPLGMKSTRLASLKEALVAQREPKKSNIPTRYFATPTGDKPHLTPAKADYIMAPYADGGVISTASDIIKWHQGLHEGKVLSKASMDLMKTKHYEVEGKIGKKSHVGYGLYITELNDGEYVYHHAGNALAIRCESGYIANKNIYFAVLSNVMNYIPKEMEDKIDMNNPKNQLDIHFFTHEIIKAIK